MGIYWKNIDPQLQVLGPLQQFNFNQNLNQLQFNNTFIPTLLTPSENLFELRNSNLSGFRFRHVTASGDTFGTLKIQSFVSGQTTGTDLMTFNADGTITLDANLVLDDLNFPKLGIGADPVTNGVIQFGNTSLSTKISLWNNNTPGNDFDQSGFGYLSGAGTIYHCPIGKSHLFFTGANGNNPVEINDLGMRVSGIGISSVDFRKITFWEIANNPNQTNAIGVQLDGLPSGYTLFRQQVATSNNSFTWNYGTSATTSNELMRLNAANGLVVKNQVVPTVGNDSYTDFKLENSAMGGYRFRHTSISGNPPVGGLSLQVMNDTGSTLDIFNIGFSTLTLPGFGGDRYTVFGGLNLNAIQATLGVNEGKWNVLNEASCFRVVSSTNSAKIEIQNTSPSGRLYEFRSNSDGSFGIFDRTSNALRLGIDPSGNISGNFSNSFGPTENLPYTQLTFNWANPASLPPGTQIPYVFNHTINDNAPFFKEHIYQVISLSPDVARSWQVIYNLGDPNAWNPSYSLKFTHPIFSPSGTTPFSLVNIGGGFAPAWGLFLTATVDMGGYEIKNALNPTTPQSLATKNYIDNSTLTLTGSVTGSGNVNGSLATSFNNNQTVIGGDTQTFNFTPSFASAYFNIFNSNASATTQIRMGNSNQAISCGYAASGGYSFINTTNVNSLQFSINGITQATLTGTGLGIGTLTPTQAKLQIVGGVQNIVGEDTAIRISSALSNVKIELQNTAAGGHLYEFRSSSTGQCDITDRTASATRLTITSLGNIGINMGLSTPNGQLQFASVNNARKIVLWEGANNDFQFVGLGNPAGLNGMAYNIISSTTDSHVFYAGTSSTTKNEVGRITGTGDCIIPGTIYGRRASGIITMQGNAVGTTVTTAGVFYKVAGTTVSSSLNQITMPVSNRITFTGSYSVTAAIAVYLCASHNGGAGDEIQFALYKNGAQISNSIISGQASNNILQAYSLETLVSMTTNDYVELYCTHPANGKIITVKNMMFNFSTT
jgi:hypothetical protein